MDKKKLEFDLELALKLALKLAMTAQKIREMHESRVSFNERKFAVISRKKIPKKYIRILKWALD